MVRIFDYTDYRQYLADYYDHRKTESPGFSYTVLARKAGFKNKGFLHNVIHGHKNLSKTSVVKLSQALEHTRTQAEYFENLVFFNQAAGQIGRAQV